ncbi:MAG: class 1 isoprenoid biosynthesis enzyme [Bacteroidales bacterium]|nr:class 1 isoprenoid biosynthesis enzyme [Bacteroidales bacterium]
MSVEKIFTLPVLISQFRTNLKKQQEFIKKTIAVDILEIKKDIDNTLTEKDFKKIFTYYGSAVPAVLGEGYCLLRGKKMTENERYRLTYMGALTGLFDDFFDEKNTEESHIKELVNNAGEQITRNSHEKLFIRFYVKVLNSGDPLRVKEHLNRVFDAQVLSKRQKDPGISKEEIRYITMEKGGSSLLFYRCAFPEQVSENERRMLYHLGGLGQLENDIFDIYKDHRDSICTLATKETRISNLRAAYLSLMYDVFTMVKQVDYPSGNRKRFLRFVSLVSSRGLVCLDHLQKQEAQSGGVFDIPSPPRENLICDMEKKYNHLRLFRYYLKNI